MTRYHVTLEMKPVPESFARVYRRRGLTPPALSSRDSLASLWPYRFRSLHRAYARSRGYFWMPCVLCTRYFGGHEIVGLIPNPTDEQGVGMMTSICPVCTAERNGGTP